MLLTHNEHWVAEIQLIHPTIKTVHNWHLKSVFNAEILGVQIAQIVGEELHYKHNGNTEIHGTHFFKVAEKAKLVLTHWLHTVALEQTEQSTMSIAHALH